ncbi:hypothetical protein A9Q92_01855 [Methylophaga sp. 42_8_T64]|nr:hypothetical protein A9Q92_01855 [Methylophaga sp. 42_8_T64]
MQLEPRQLSTLDEMGIPVWELRNTASNLPIAEPVVLNEQQLSADWLIVHGSENHTQAKQQLLSAILKAIGVEISDVAVINQQQLPSLSTQSLANKTVLVFGNQFLSELLPEHANSDDAFAEVHRLNNAGLNMIVTHDLSDLIQQPEKKRDTWQALKLAQRTVKQPN